jgi:cytochrome c oxidase subunit 2
MEKPLIEVSKGDLVVLKLTSSDVVHGFSLKDFGVFITEGIHPGKVRLVSFRADKVGSFTFSCNAICGDNHKNMQGTLVVTA